MPSKVFNVTTVRVLRPSSEGEHRKADDLGWGQQGALYPVFGSLAQPIRDEKHYCERCRADVYRMRVTPLKGTPFVVDCFACALRDNLIPDEFSGSSRP